MSRAARLRWLRLRRALATPQFIARSVAVVVLLAALAATAIATWVAAEYERSEARHGFDHSVEQAVNTIAARITLYLAIAQAGRALFIDPDEVDAEDWRDFAAGWRDRGATYPPLDSLVYVRYYGPGETPGVEVDPPGDRPEYCPVVFTAPEHRFPPFIGYDLCTRPVSRAAMEAASTSGSVALSGRVLVSNQSSGATRDGVVIYAPVFRPDGRLHGWTTLPLAIADLFADALPADLPVSVSLYDGSVDSGQPMFTDGRQPTPESMTRTETLMLAGHRWVMRFHQPGVTTRTATLVAAGGLSIALLLFILLWRAGSVHARAVAMAERLSAAYRSSEERYRTIISSLEDAYFETDLAGNLRFFNNALVRLLGYSRRELDGMNNRAYMDEANAEMVFAAFNLVYETTEPQRGVQWEVTRKDGERRYIEASISLTRDDTGEPTGFRGIARDITERRRADERIHYLAHYDSLTGLPNRALFEDRMAQVLKQRREGGESAALLFLDLDRFKTINDSLGHHAGDELLKQVARRISECVRDGDTVCRPGGDEFLVLLGQLRSPATAGNVASKILRAVSAPYTVEGWEFSVTPSIGIAVIPEDGTDIETLTRNADTAMYYAKESGRNNFQFFSSSMNQDADHRLALEQGLRRAIERQELELYYQPVADGRDGRIVSAEALLRWNRPGHGVLGAHEFIAVVEQSGMILEIGEWVLREACRHAASWGIPVAVNLSGLQFRKTGLVELVAAVIRDTGLPPSGLELEITESVLIEDAYQTVDTVNRLRALGVRFAIDDFGTGYSSLGYLKRFPIDRVKIDRAFIRDLNDNPDDAAIVNAIISMTASLGLEAVAEGVETTEQREYLLGRGCTLMQGYLFGRPMPAADFAARLAAS